MLRALGLDAVSEQVYQELLAEPTLDATLLAERLGLSQDQVGASLDTLADLALLRMSREAPQQRRPVSPERARALLLRHEEEELRARHTALEANRTAVATAAERATRERQRIPSGTEQLDGLDEIQSRLESLLQSATTEICSIVPTLMPPEALEAARPLDEDLLGRGVTQRTLCHEGVRTNPRALAYGRSMAAVGAQLRTAPALPHRLLMVDRAIALVPLDPASTAPSAVLVTSPGIVAALAELFDRIWADAAPLDQTPAPDCATGITAAERELLRILSTGLTDEVAAKRLGVSVRTVKRRMEELMRRLEAGSRFEAGFKACQHGWL
ncbi:sugar-specific transcriptional regulator TrmB/DNA-binding CsgD family transcriptional regulator [Kitasatospora sp. MAP12-15]|uniref:LuxR C-terminal-related transcriptional regulator n=1 Tax=unclassified Kitasatospora TaxID=2633591 RepID=UPI0024755D35|nr:LuxR C-terminal-related transcriptional regulator [Kitasatospora sp. MAP12-44]MDH6107836.1 sugar-specific transcriptional regulator TrmB/DNA-binding CsgD family transcriptional regulator [Kitasatospora sp. MAP12-44]